VSSPPLRSTAIDGASDEDAANHGEIKPEQIRQRHTFARGAKRKKRRTRPIHAAEEGAFVNMMNSASTLHYRYRMEEESDNWWLKVRNGKIILGGLGAVADKGRTKKKALLAPPADDDRHQNEPVSPRAGYDTLVSVTFFAGGEDDYLSRSKFFTIELFFMSVQQEMGARPLERTCVTYPVRWPSTHRRMDSRKPGRVAS
jgi:hypothetical protein